MLLSEADYQLPEHLIRLKEIAFLKEMAYKCAEEIEKLYNGINVSVNLITDEREEVYQDNLRRGIERYEKMYGLSYDDTFTLAERKLQIQLKQLQFDYMDLTSFLRAMKTVGGDDVHTTINYPGKTINVQVDLPSSRMYDMIKRFTKEYMPLGWNVNVFILYNDFRTLNEHTYSEFSNLSWEELRRTSIGG